jgi:hypothetical protein
LLLQFVPVLVIWTATRSPADAAAVPVIVFEQVLLPEVTAHARSFVAVVLSMTVTVASSFEPTVTLVSA